MGVGFCCLGQGLQQRADLGREEEQGKEDGELGGGGSGGGGGAVKLLRMLLVLVPIAGWTFVS